MRAGVNAGVPMLGAPMTGGGQGVLCNGPTLSGDIGPGHEDPRSSDRRSKWYAGWWSCGLEERHAKAPVRPQHAELCQLWCHYSERRAVSALSAAALKEFPLVWRPTPRSQTCCVCCSCCNPPRSTGKVR